MVRFQAFNLAWRHYQPEQQARGFDVANRLWLILAADIESDLPTRRLTSFVDRRNLPPGLPWVRGRRVPMVPREFGAAVCKLIEQAEADMGLSAVTGADPRLLQPC